MPPEHSESLNLWKHHLGRIPDEVWELLEIETLVPADNDLTEVSSRIRDLKHLSMLDLVPECRSFSNEPLRTLVRFSRETIRRANLRLKISHRRVVIAHIPRTGPPTVLDDEIAATGTGGR